MQFTERNPVIIGIIITAVTVAVTWAGLSIQRSDLVGGYEITAEFADANGLRVGDQVLVAGVRAGRVLDLQIAGNVVEARMQVEDVDLPADTRARVVLRTLVGTRAVALEAGSNFDSDLLAEGDVIPLERTETTLDVPDFGEASDDLLTEIDSEAFNTFLRALTDLTEGQRAEVADLVEGGTRLTSLVNEQETQIRELLQQLRGVGTTLNSRDAELISIIDDFDVALGQLADRREDIRRLFREGNAASIAAGDLIVSTRADLDRILSEVHQVVDILDANQRNLAEALAYGGDAIYGFASIALAVGDQPVPWGDVFVTGLGPASIDVLAGCGGLIDQQLDQILGPDPRTCEEQENQTMPDDARREEGDPEEQGPEVPDLPIPELPPLSLSTRSSADAVARRLLPATEVTYASMHNAGEVGR
jgi:phospholipid/cholesterol/gamma-HCH transport system substrate-binding protein